MDAEGRGKLGSGFGVEGFEFRVKGLGSLGLVFVGGLWGFLFVVWVFFGVWFCGL